MKSLRNWLPRRSFRSGDGAKCNQDVKTSIQSEEMTVSGYCGSEDVTSRGGHTANEKVAQAFIRHINNHDTKFLSLCHPRADIVFPEASMTLGEYAEEQSSVLKSFPDFRLDCATEITEQEDGLVVVNVYGHGTHTGEPYGFGPYPAIERKGIYCRNDPEKVTFTVRDGKITKMKVEPKGELSGPPGFYSQIGGVIF